jgi:hypothetical protein
MQEADERVHTWGRRWHRRLYLILTMVPLGFLWPAVDVAATTGVLIQRLGTDGCVSENGTMGTCMDGHALLGAAMVAVSPDGLNVYAASYISNALAVFNRE